MITEMIINYDVKNAYKCRETHIVSLGVGREEKKWV
jgi:hypothetical protein